MAVFQDEYFETTQKMAEAMMEYAAQSIAQDYLEEYKSAEKDPKGPAVLSRFDEEMDSLLRKGNVAKPVGHTKKLVKGYLHKLAIIWVCLSSAFCVTAIVVTPLRTVIVDFFSKVFLR